MADDAPLAVVTRYIRQQAFIRCESIGIFPHFQKLHRFLPPSSGPARQETGRFHLFNQTAFVSGPICV
ncbi:hypothetical protein [Lignipirellula cremea]|uniref:hypothetical protein n=1 Tax=Lignipirellula cremea TaxID=2528010 RepID=UPI0011AAA2BA|nr:hypothetical protein [Lignipirellula cremea]